MAKRKPKFYVVWKGAKPGVYNTWPEANAQVAGFPGAKFKSFPSRSAAEHAFKVGPSKAGDAFPNKKKSPSSQSSASIIKPSLSVDAACSGNPGKMEYQGVSTATKERIFHQAFPIGTNNIGEFLALIHGIAFLESEGLHDMPIYTDSKIAMGWVKKKKCKTTLPRNAKTEKLYQLIDRGEAWLKANTFKNPILKWETKHWGEIPADFGRK
jgi:ribonuclease HI